MTFIFLSNDKQFSGISIDNSGVKNLYVPNFTCFCPRVPIFIAIKVLVVEVRHTQFDKT